jgi:hypothetical protein
MDGDVRRRIAGRALPLADRAWVVGAAAAVGTMSGEVVAAAYGDGVGLMLVALVAGAPVGAILLVVRRRNLLVAGAAAAALLFSWCAVEYQAGGTSSTSGLAVLWLSRIGVPVALSLALADRVLLGDA